MSVRVGGGVLVPYLRSRSNCLTIQLLISTKWSPKLLTSLGKWQHNPYVFHDSLAVKIQAISVSKFWYSFIKFVYAIKQTRKTKLNL